MSKRVTIEVLAKKCGVSKSTVSRVLNNHENNFSVLPEKRELILKTAKELNYKPNVAASSLKTQQTNIVEILGFTAQTHNSPSVYTMLVNKAVDNLIAAGYHACSSFPHPDRGVNAMLPWKVDGAIVVHCRGENSLVEVEKSGIPYISVSADAGPNGISLKVDDKKGMKLAMKHLYDLGHRNIAYCNTSGFVTHYSVNHRYNAYIDECNKRSIPVMPGADEYNIEAELFWKNVVIPSKATAVLAYSHVEALELYFSAKQLGIDIPGQVSLMCFNDVYPCENLSPSITTMAIPSQEMGQKAAETLIEMMQSGRLPKQREYLFEETLIERESTNSPKIN